MALASVGEVDLVVVGHLDLDPGAVGGDLVDLADGDAEHPDVAALVEGDGAREVGGEPVGVVAAAEEREAGGHDEQDQDDERARPRA